MTDPMRAIDLSHHNGNVDFQKVKKSGIDAVILRTGYGKYMTSQIDRRFFENYDKAKKAGLFVGAYHYSYATTAAGAEEEAEAMKKIVKDKTFELPLYIDIEEPRHKVMDKKMCTAMVAAFCNSLEKDGYWAGVYSFDSFFKTNLEQGICDRYTAWVARVENVKPKDCPRYDVWQYSWKGRIPGIKGDVDMDYIYRDFPMLINKAHKNGF